MKATINGIEVEGTPEEVAELASLINGQFKITEYKSKDLEQLITMYSKSTNGYHKEPTGCPCGRCGQCYNQNILHNSQPIEHLYGVLLFCGNIAT